MENQIESTEKKNSNYKGRAKGTINSNKILYKLYIFDIQNETYIEPEPDMTFTSKELMTKLNLSYEQVLALSNNGNKVSRAYKKFYKVEALPKRPPKKYISKKLLKSLEQQN